MIKGIDVSHWQGNPDFKRVKAAGINYVIIKATEGINYIDPCFKANVQAAITAGLPAGAYHFLRAGDVTAQVHDFLAAIKPYKPALLAIDVENPYKDGKVIPEISNLGKAAITDRIITIYKAICAAGYTCPVYVYSSKSWFGTYIDTDRCKSAGMLIWLAWYSNAMPDNTDRSGLCDMWQYCSDGCVDGINGKVDCNVSYKDFGAASFKCDTTIDLARARGGWYQFKVTSKTHPKVNVGSDGVATILPRCQSGDDYFYYIIAYGASGTATGVYVNDILQFNFKIK